jgi:hypothetical protein
MQEVPGGIGSVTIIEPDAKRRKELEVKGNHWHDVVRGMADGPDLPALNAAPPPGWTKEDFDKRLRTAKVDAGDDMTQPLPSRAEVTPDGRIIGEDQLPQPTTEEIESFLKMLEICPRQVCGKCETTYILRDILDVMELCPVCQSPLEPPTPTEPPGLDNLGAAG